MELMIHIYTGDKYTIYKKKTILRSLVMKYEKHDLHKKNSPRW